jgi:putative sigma-54 modulation protein
VELRTPEEEERRLTMEVEFTARQVIVSKAVRSQAEEGLERVARILGRGVRASVVFRAQRHLQIAD